MLLRRFGRSQRTFEGCLAVCLLMLAGEIPNRTKETTIILHALRTSKFSFISGHLDFLKRKLHCHVTAYSEAKAPGAALRHQWHRHRVDVPTIKRLVKDGPAIVYLDSFVLWNKIHYPHFVIITSSPKHAFVLFDPWDGKFRTTSGKTIAGGIRSLRTRLRIAPVIFQVRPVKNAPLRGA